ncbi:MAG TPA: HNH endonuclease signature motif containing protein [Myxococcaceae bacterium]
MVKLRPHLCAEPGCPEIVEGAGRCPAHQGKGDWGRFQGAGAYGAAWRRARNAYLAQHPGCERCPAPATQVHHRNHDPTNHNEANLESLCDACHRTITAQRSAHIRRQTRTRNRTGRP